jgi:hypothetical protein
VLILESDATVRDIANFIIAQLSSSVLDIDEKLSIKINGWHRLDEILVSSLPISKDGFIYVEYYDREEVLDRQPTQIVQKYDILDSLIRFMYFLLKALLQVLHLPL